MTCSMYRDRRNEGKWKALHVLSGKAMNFLLGANSPRDLSVYRFLLQKR